MTNKPTTLREYSTKAFIREYMNDHNGGTPRWLRGAFWDEKEKIETILEFMQGIEARLTSHNTELIRKIEEMPTVNFGAVLEEQKGIYIKKQDVINIINQEK